VSRRPIPLAAVAVLAITVALPLFMAAKAPKNEPAPAQEPTSETAALTSTGEVVDCTDYLFFGKKGPDRVDTQTRHIDSGMPACFIADADHDVYLLLAPDTQAKVKFDPVANWLAGDVLITGIVYQKGSLKALAVDSIKRQGGYTDRQSRRPSNPEPSRKLNPKDPKKTPNPTGVAP
jgi:hypothetical protein